MMYPYKILPDETEIVHSNLILEDDIQKVIVHFERPTENGFNSARCSLPNYTSPTLPFHKTFPENTFLVLCPKSLENLWLPIHHLILE